MIPAEVRRRLVHAAGALVPAAYLFELLAWRELQLLYLVGLAVAIGLETLRLVVGLDWRLFDELTREYEATNPAGYALYVASSTLVVLGFRPAIALPAVLALALVDPVSGLLSGRGAPGRPKRAAVLAVTFGLATLIAAGFVPIGPAIFAGMAVTLADGFTPVVAGYVIDDNLTIPPATAAAVWLGLQLQPLS